MAASCTSAALRCGALPAMPLKLRNHKKAAHHHHHRERGALFMNRPIIQKVNATSDVARGDEGGTSSSRRAFTFTAAVTAAAAAGVFTSPGPAAAAAANTTPVTFSGVPNERWMDVPTTVNLPESWSPRPGQREKQSKFMLYTDTYGPNYRYTTALPRYVDADGAVVANSIAVLVQSRGGQDSITDLGPQSGIDAPKAFGIEAEDIALAEQGPPDRRELLCPGGSHVLISACISGGGLHVLSVEATADQWGRNGDALRGVMTSFNVPVALESTTDISNRIYNNASTGGFK